MTRSTPCPVVGCDGTAIGSLVIYTHPDGGLGRNRMVAACSRCWRTVGEGATVLARYAPGDTGRRSPRVRLGHRTAPG